MSALRTSPWLVLLVFTALACGGGSLGSGGDTGDVAPDQVEIAPEIEIVEVIEKDEPVCPGECCTDAACDDGDSCTTDRCVANACVHEDVVCDDDNVCTTDSCSADAGCRYEAIAGCCVPGATDTVYAQDMEGSLDDLSIEDLGGDADVRATWQVSTLRYHSQGQSLHFGIPEFGTYDNGARVAARVVTPAIPLPGGRRAALSLWLWLDIEAAPERDQISIALLTGDARVPLAAKESAWIDRTWHQVQVDLSAFGGGDVRIEVLFDSRDASANAFHGVYLDDLVVTSLCEDPTCAALPDCDDGIACTTGACDDPICTFAFVDDCCLAHADCRDADACTIDACTDGLCTRTEDPDPLCCNADADCDDGDPCTTETCADTRCRYLPSGEPGCCALDSDCDDGDPCTIDACVDGACSLTQTCCLSDADCDDGDDICTLDLCVEGACLHEPTGVAGCCDPVLVELSFDDGDPGDFSFENSDPVMGWQIFGAEGASSADSKALYYGNATDPTTLTFDNGAVNSGVARLPVQIEPEGSAITLAFDAFLDTEGAPDYDALTFSLKIADAGYHVWDKSKLKGPAAWHHYEIDLSAFAGAEGTLEIRFDTVDNTVNYGEGVYIDNLALTSSCAPRPCESDADCADGIAASVDRCLPSGSCTYERKDTPCTVSATCDDQDPCTLDACTGGFCDHLPQEGCCHSDSECVDANACRVDTCVSTGDYPTCEYTWSPGCCIAASDCEDGDPCTVDTCPSAGQSCAHQAVAGCCLTHADCNDGDAATRDTCTAAGCTHPPETCTIDSDCGDGDPCTDEICLDGVCAWLPDDAPACCPSPLLSASFDDGTPGPFTLLTPDHGLAFALSGDMTNSGPYALRASGVVGAALPETARARARTLPLRLLPNTQPELRFALWIDPLLPTDEGTLEVALWTDLGRIVVWSVADRSGVAGAWSEQQVDLTPFAGQTGPLELSYAPTASLPDTAGVFIDDVRVQVACSPQVCASDEPCASFDACRDGQCVDGFCLFGGRSPDCCSFETECDDGNTCTLDACPVPGAPCQHDWAAGCCRDAADCEDANPCTTDACDANLHECRHAALADCCLTNTACDDGDATTVDVCLNGSCHSRPALCAVDEDCDDQDACTSATCIGGSCAYLPVATPACCPGMLLDASFDEGSLAPMVPIGPPAYDLTWRLNEGRHGDTPPASLHFGVPAGPGCDDGWSVTVADSWTAAGCQGIVADMPTLFRVYEIAVVSPAFTYDPGSGPISLNQVLSAVATSHLDLFEGGGLVFALDPLVAGFPRARLYFGEGACTFDGGQPLSCGFLLDEGKRTSFEDVMIAAEGTCGEGGPGAPCFLTGEAGFDLPTIIPGIFPAGTEGIVTGMVSGSLVGDPVQGVSGARLRAFAPRELLETYAIDEQITGRPVTVAELLDPTTMTTHDDVSGWWIELAVSATRLPYESPSGCVDAPTACDDGDPCTLDGCDTTTGQCTHGVAPDGGACDDQDPRTALDRCVAGACTGTYVGEPLSFRFTDLTLLEPLLVHDPGTGVEPVNATLAAWFTERLGVGGDIVLQLDPTDAPGPGAHIDAGQCLGTPGAQACGPISATPDASFLIAHEDSGTCGAGPTVDAPCFEGVTLASATLHLPGHAPLPVRAFEGMGTFSGSPTPVGVADGRLVFFVTHDAASAWALDEAALGSPRSLADLLVDATPAMLEDASGWWFELGFQATRVGYLAGGCADDEGACRDGDPATADLCRPGLGACQHAAQALVPPSGSIESPIPVTGSVFTAPLTLPPASSSAMAFSLFLDAPLGGTPPLAVRVHGDAGPLVVWDASLLDPDDARAWRRHVLDLTAFEGQAVRIEFRADVPAGARGEGIFLDEIRVDTGCQTISCDTDSDCPAPDPCRIGACLEGLCVYVDAPGCCLADEACADGSPCTTDLCADNQCRHVAVEGCCDTDGACDDGIGCTVDVCLPNRTCRSTYDGSCATTLPYVQGFTDLATLGQAGWTASTATGVPAANWKLSAPLGGMDDHLLFDDTPVAVAYDHRVHSPLLNVPEGTPLHFSWQAYFAAYAGATTPTRCRAEVSADGGATWTEVWSATYQAEGAPLETQDVDVSPLLGGSTKARVAFAVSGQSSYDILGWHVDDVRVLTGRAPEVAPLPARTVFTGQTTRIIVDATDPDDDPLWLLLPPNAPAFATLVEPAEALAIDLLPTVEDLGPHALRVLVTDGQFQVPLTLDLTVTSNPMLLAEDFDADATLTALGWSVRFETNEGGGVHWERIAQGGLDGSGAAAFDGYPPVSDFGEWLVSPLFDASSAAGEPVHVQFAQQLAWAEGAASPLTLTLRTSKDAGASWNVAWTATLGAGEGLPDGLPIVAVPGSFEGSQEARIAFTISGPTSTSLSAWQIDDVRVVRGSPPELAATGSLPLTIGQSTTLALPTSDADDDVVTVTWVHGPGFASLAGSPGAYQLACDAPATNEHGVHEVVLWLSDGHFGLEVVRTLDVRFAGEARLFEERFDDLPDLEAAGWTIVREANEGADTHWMTLPEGALNGGVLSFTWTPEVTDYAERVETPSFSAADAAERGASLVFRHLLDVDGTTTLGLSVLASLDQGGTWDEIWSLPVQATSADDDQGPARVAVALPTGYPGSPDVRLAFRIAGDDTFAIRSWQIDDLVVVAHDE